jgi:hypothetical protein
VLLKPARIPTLTICLRKDLLFQYYNEIKPETKWKVVGDHPLYLWFAFNSKIHFFDEVTGVFRVLEKSDHFPTSYERGINIVKEVFDSKIYFADLYNFSYIKGTIENGRMAGYANIAINSKKYTDFKKYMSGVKTNTTRLKIKKIIAKSIILIIIYQYIRLFKQWLDIMTMKKEY